MKAEGMLRLYCKLFDFKTAANLLETIDLSYDSFVDKGDWFNIVQAAIRVYSELDQKEKLEKIIEDVLFLSDQFRTVELLITLIKIEFESASLDKTQKILDELFTNELSGRYLALAQYAQSLVFFYQNKIDESLQWVLSLKVESTDYEMQIAQSLWLGQVYFSKRNFILSREHLLRAKELCQVDRNVYFFVKTICTFVEILHVEGKFEESQVYLRQALDLIPIDFQTKTKLICESLFKKVNTVPQKKGFELIESEAYTVLKLPNGQIVDVTYQRQLFILLKGFISSPDYYLSKEKIWNLLWNTDYHPLNCDNKIYVTIRRLRKILSENQLVPDFLLQKEDGYRLNKEYKFTLFQHRYFEEDHKMN